MDGLIKQVNEGNDGAFVYEMGGKRLAEMVYTMHGDKKMVILHTEVDESLKGQSIGKKLLAALIDFVRAKQMTVVPVCPFARAMFQKTDAWKDVLL